MGTGGGDGGRATFPEENNDVIYGRGKKENTRKAAADLGRSRFAIKLATQSTVSRGWIGASLHRVVRKKRAEFKSPAENSASSSSSRPGPPEGGGGREKFRRKIRLQSCCV